MRAELHSQPFLLSYIACLLLQQFSQGIFQSLKHMSLKPAGQCSEAQLKFIHQFQTKNPKSIISLSCHPSVSYTSLWSTFPQFCGLNNFEAILALGPRKQSNLCLPNYQEQEIKPTRLLLCCSLKGLSQLFPAGAQILWTLAGGPGA